MGASHVRQERKQLPNKLRHLSGQPRWPARPYSSRDAGSGVVLRHRAAAAVDAAATYCTPEGAAQIGPADGFLHNHCLNSRGFTKCFFSNLVFYNCGLPLFSQKTIFPTMCTTIRSYSMGRGFDLKKEGTHIFRRFPSLNSGALAVAAEKFWRRY